MCYTDVIYLLTLIMNLSCNVMQTGQHILR